MERNNVEYTRLSRECQRHLRAGRLDWYSFDLKSMAKILSMEGKYVDKAKVLMIAFYIDLSGVGHPPFVDRAAVISLKTAIRQSGMDEYQVKELYLESVRSDTTPRHIMTVSDSLYLMELSLDDREYEVGAILDNFHLNRSVE
ncbi:MAG: hypothetical protein IKJ99_02875 [Oscillospiraceae bacterium]|nr:hypothetical protein [Oscillospiraceae bacterium]